MYWQPFKLSYFLQELKKNKHTLKYTQSTRSLSQYLHACLASHAFCVIIFILKDYFMSHISVVKGSYAGWRFQINSKKTTILSLPNELQTIKTAKISTFVLWDQVKRLKENLAHLCFVFHFQGVLQPKLVFKLMTKLSRYNSNLLMSL